MGIKYLYREAALRRWLLRCRGTQQEEASPFWMVAMGVLVQLQAV